MLRAEPRLERMARSIDRMTRALMLALMSMRDTNGGKREQAQNIVREIEEESDNRKERWRERERE